MVATSAHPYLFKNLQCKPAASKLDTRTPNAVIKTQIIILVNSSPPNQKKPKPPSLFRTHARHDDRVHHGPKGVNDNQDLKAAEQTAVCGDVEVLFSQKKKTSVTLVGGGFPGYDYPGRKEHQRGCQNKTEHTGYKKVRKPQALRMRRRAPGCMRSATARIRSSLACWVSPTRAAK